MGNAAQLVVGRRGLGVVSQSYLAELADDSEVVAAADFVGGNPSYWDREFIADAFQIPSDGARMKSSLDTRADKFFNGVEKTKRAGSCSNVRIINFG